MASTPKATTPSETATPSLATPNLATQGLHTSTAATGDAPHASKFPPFDPFTFAPQLVWLAISFGALYLVMSRIALPGIASVLAERRGRIQRDLAEAERLKAETDAALKSYEKSLADARGKAQTLAKDMRDRMAADTDRERRRIDDANAAKLVETETRIAETKGRALANVDALAAETASDIVERLIGQRIGTDEVRKVIADPRILTPVA